MKLAYELEEYIISFLPYEKTLNYPFICKQKRNPLIHNWDCAVWNGNLDVVKWFWYNRTEFCCCTTCAVDIANVKGHLDVVKWLSEIRCTEKCLYCKLYLFKVK
jgi:hypothetical protein